MQQDMKWGKTNFLLKTGAALLLFQPAEHIYNRLAIELPFSHPDEKFCCHARFVIPDESPALSTREIVYWTNCVDISIMIVSKF